MKAVEACMAICDAGAATSGLEWKQPPSLLHFGRRRLLHVPGDCAGELAIDDRDTRTSAERSPAGSGLPRGLVRGGCEEGFDLGSREKPKK